METQFEYRRIGSSFLNEIRDLVLAGESAVLLSVRDLGKRYVLKVLNDGILEDGAMLSVDVEFPHEPALLTPAAVRSLLATAVAKAAPDFTYRRTTQEDESLEDLLAPVRQLCRDQPRRVVLLASNVDSLGHHLAQRLLREARALVSQPARPLIAVLTGEENLGDLVHGENSEFNCANQFVIQGFEEPEFLACLRRRRQRARIQFGDDDSCLQLLFRETGGNIHLARAALWAWLELRARTFEEDDPVVDTQAFTDFLHRFPASEACGMDVFLSTTRTICRVPEAWRDLNDLRKGCTVNVQNGSAPHIVEIAGLAIRTDGQLRYASPIMEEFARQYYDDRRLGDLHAVYGQWREAITFYERMPEYQRRRPGGAADSSQLDLLCKAIGARMHALATEVEMDGQKKLDDLKSIFAEGCRYLLGFSEVTFWEFTAQWKREKNQQVNIAVYNLAIDVLEQANRHYVGYQRLPAPLDTRAALAILPSVRPDWRDAVVVSDTQHMARISRERAEFLRQLLVQFTSAYDHIIANWGVKLRLEARHRHLEIATSIVSALGETIRNPGDALKLAGDQLLKLGYRRIMFALVDPQRQRIRGVSFCCGELPKEDVAKGTNWPLAEFQEDIQPWVVHFAKHCKVDDWRNWNDKRSPDLPPINKVLCEMAETAYNFVVVPMILQLRDVNGNAQDIVFGTIQVEKLDGLPLSDDEIEDLLEFGRQMAAAVHQIERMGTLLEALHIDRHSVIVFDKESSVRFANQAAANRFGIKSGWHDAHVRLHLPNAALMDKVISVISGGKSMAQFDTSSETGLTLQEAVFCSPLPDWRTKSSPAGAIGAVLQIDDLTGLHRIFNALQTVAKSAASRESAIVAVLQAIQELGYPAARLYFVNPEEPDWLCSVRASGLPPSQADNFAEGKFRMHRADVGRADIWKCLETGEPQVNRWDPSVTEPSKKVSSRGVTVNHLRQPAFESSWKVPGALWIDLPLLAPEHMVGKLSVDVGKDCDGEIEPEEFELLKIFSSLLGALLAALDKEAQIKAVADLAISTTAHKIGTKLAGLSGFARRYSEAAPGNAKVGELNRWTGPLVGDCLRLVQSVRETFADMELVVSPTPLRPLLEDTLNGLFSNQHREGKINWEIDCPDNLTPTLDPFRFRQALEALLENSRAMVSEDRQLAVVVKAKLLRPNKDILEIRVRDNGPGVAPEVRERIFEPFFSQRQGGQRSSGLGLNLAQKVVAKHGGHIRLEEPREVGAEFVMEIPVPKLLKDEL